MQENNEKLNHCMKLLAVPPKVDRNKQPPKCRCCQYYQPEFRYRKWGVVLPDANRGAYDSYRWGLYL